MPRVSLLRPGEDQLSPGRLSTNHKDARPSLESLLDFRLGRDRYWATGNPWLTQLAPKLSAIYTTLTLVKP